MTRDAPPAGPLPHVRFRRLAALRSAVISRIPEIGRTYWRERAAIEPLSDKEPLFIYRSPATRRARCAMARRRQSAPLNLKGTENLAEPQDFPNLTLCTVLHNSLRWVEGWAESLAAADYPREKLHVVLVDSGSEDGGLEACVAALDAHGLRDRVAATRRVPNAGYGAAQNRAVSEAETDYVFLLNPDARLTEQTLKTLLRAAHDDAPDVCAWECRQLPFEHVKYYDPVTQETSWNSHAAILLRREAFLEVGGYDPHLFMYGEDVDISYRLRARGYRLRYVPDACVEHDISDGDPLRTRFLPNQIAANLLLRRRFGSAWDRLVGRILISRSRNHLDTETRARISQLVSRSREHFDARHPNPAGADFPFNGFHYERRRRGALTPLASDTVWSPRGPGASLPTVSIITRTRGASPALEECARSVRQQTYPGTEHIVIVDRDPALRIPDLPHARQIEISAGDRRTAGRVGLEAAAGDYVMFLDDDDLLFADHVEGLVQAARSGGPDTIGAYGYSWEAQVRDRYNDRCDRRLDAQTAMEATYSGDDLAQRNCFAIQSVLMRRDIIDKAGGMAGSGALEDWELWRRCLEHGSLARYAKTTSIYTSERSILTRIRRALAHANDGSR